MAGNYSRSARIENGSDYHSAVSSAISDAVHYIDEDVAPEREQAQQLYRGDPLGNEEEGRSQVVMTEVRDVIQAILPTLLRVFCGHESTVEFVPNLEEHAEAAEQATDYVNYIFQVDNPGFQILFSAFKDALLKKTGIVMWFPDDRTQVVEEEYSGMTEDDLSVLESEGGVEILERTEDDIDPLLAQAGMQTYTATIRRTITKRRFRVEVVPPEEFIVSRDARCEDSATLIGRRREITVSDLIAMGYELEEIEPYFGSSTGFETNTEREVRNPFIRADQQEVQDESLRKVLYIEAYMLIDGDDDGIAERRKICCIGDGHHIVSDTMWNDMVPFATFCPDPEPHKLIGRSTADDTKDLQYIKSAIVRNTLDSLAQSIHPRTVAVEGAVNMDDVLNTETGGVIRAKVQGAVQQLNTTFVGLQAMPILQYMDEIRGQRTGITRATQGLDADALQSTTKAAVSAMTNAAEQRIEMIARIFAETGMTRLFRGLLRMVIRNQDHERIVKLRGKFVPVDPRSWDADMAVSVNVGLGMGNVEEKAQILSMVADKQEQIIMQTGPMNPLCSILELRNTYADLVALGKIKDVSRYFRPITAEEVQQYAQQEAEKQQQNNDDPASKLAEAEMMKAQVDMQTKMLKAQLDYVKARQEDDRKRDEMFQNMMLKVAELEARYGAQVQVAQIRHEQERARDAFDAQLKQQPGMPAQ